MWQAWLMAASLVSSSSLAAAPTSLSVIEESPAGTVIGSLSKALGLSVSEMHRRQFQLLPGPHTDLVKVDLAKGVLKVSSRIDRELLCSSRTSSSCVLPLEAILAQPVRSPARLSLHVVDINDHSPTFRSPHVTMSISEGASINSRFPMQGAVDLDAGHNGQLSYTLTGAPTFKLDIKQDGAFGGGSLELVLQQPLDREREPQVLLTLTAHDHGDRPRSSSCKIVISVADINDHTPTFEQTVYKANISEGTKPGSTLIRVAATDDDDGVNGIVKYAFASLTELQERRMFAIHPQTGELTLRTPLDYEEKASHELYIEASDGGLGGVPAYCKVTITVEDENDNTPQITFPSEDEHKLASLSISEVEAPGSFVMFVRVEDQDSGDNGRTSLRFESPVPFRLRQLRRGDFIIVTEGQLDREKTRIYNLTLVAEDGGTPPLQTRSSLQLHVTDGNDNAPRFDEPFYEVSVEENNRPNVLLLTVSARDHDEGDNGRIAYEIVELGNQRPGASELVVVDGESGAVHAIRSFDRESIRAVHFVIKAEDRGEPRRSASVQVTVVINDVNDNAPKVKSPRLQGGNATVYALRGLRAAQPVTVVAATDPDFGDNGRLAFRLLRGNSDLFQLDRDSGQITNVEDLSGPEGERYELLVEVSDKGVPPRSTLASLCIVLVNSLPQPQVHDNEDDTSTHLLGLPLILIVSLGSVCMLLLIIMVTVALVCRRENKEMRTYNCRTAETFYSKPPSELATNDGDVKNGTIGNGPHAAVDNEPHADQLCSCVQTSVDQSNLLPTRNWVNECLQSYGANSPQRCSPYQLCPNSLDLSRNNCCDSNSKVNDVKRDGHFNRPYEGIRRLKGREIDGLSTKDSGRGESDPRDSEGGESDQDQNISLHVGYHCQAHNGPSRLYVPKSLTPTWELLGHVAEARRIATPSPAALSSPASPTAVRRPKHRLHLSPLTVPPATSCGLSATSQPPLLHPAPLGTFIDECMAAYGANDSSSVIDRKCGNLARLKTMNNFEDPSSSDDGESEKSVMGRPRGRGPRPRPQKPARMSRTNSNGEAKYRMSEVNGILRHLGDRGGSSQASMPRPLHSNLDVEQYP
uniref:protocadherin beta-16-like n=1 Tax=Myxine glutinosa TaxID=7769 RepID=UPI0035901558